MLPQSNNENPYHHGNVKKALIDAALDVITGDAAGDISLRGLARKVGITPAAVYNHFTDKDALLLAIKMRIYRYFNEFVEERLTETENPEQSLLEICLAYYHFSREHPRYFNFLFSSVLPAQWSTPEFVEVACRCLVRTRKLVLSIYEKYQVSCSEELVVNTTLLVWSQLHGIVTLRNSGSIQAAVAYQDWPQSSALNRDEEVEGIIRNHVHLMVNGILNSQRLGDSGH